MNGIHETLVSSESPPTPTAAAPIDRLPAEVLAAIFVRLSERGPNFPRGDVPGFVRGLVSVTHVRRLWRKVAINKDDEPGGGQDTPGEVWRRSSERGFPLSKQGLDTGRGSTRSQIPASLCVRASRTLRPVHVLYEPGPLLEVHYSPGVQKFLLFDDQVPRLRELVIVTAGSWLQNRLGNLTSLHLILLRAARSHSELLPFFDMPHRCPDPEELFILWDSWETMAAVPAQLPAVSLHSL